MGFWDKRILLPCITSWAVDWRSYIKEADELGIKSIGLFLTGIDREERKEMYELLETTKIESIPFVHLKSDMDPAELDYFINRWGTKAFNIHTEEEFKQENDLSKYSDLIYLENVYLKFNEDEVKKWAGLCVDVNHIEEAKYFYKDILEHNLRIINKYKIGCNHLSPLKGDLTTGVDFNNAHILENLSEYDYLLNYPAKFFGPILSLEVRNSPAEQLPALQYIVKLLNDKED